METSKESPVNKTCPISSLIKDALSREPLATPVDAMSDKDVHLLGSKWAADLMDCMKRLIDLLTSSHTGSNSLISRCPSTQVLVHLFATGCSLSGYPWSQPTLTEAVNNGLRPLLPTLTPNLLKHLDFQPALAPSDEPGCVPFYTASLVTLLCHQPQSLDYYPIAEQLSQSGQRHGVTLTARLCSHHNDAWQLLGLDCLSAGLLTLSQSGLARDLLRRLNQSRDPTVLERSLRLTASLRPICPPLWLLDTVYVDCLQCLSYECRPLIKLARLKALPDIIERLGIDSIKYGSLLVKCIDNGLSSSDRDTLECVCLLIDAYLRYCLYERQPIARVLINFAMYNPQIDCRHLPNIDGQFVAEVCRQVVAEVPELSAALGRYIS